MTVVDASVVFAALVDDDTDGDTARARLRGRDLWAPELVDLEVMSALRRHHASGALPSERAREAVRDLGALPIRRMPHRPLLDRCWDLRGTLTTYDAAYVALAELLDLPLLTADARLARASGPRCQIEVI